ncbi:3352_t:CDS:2 [Acaulospora morrowiae]|uniref:3352_t:CDS:1 n=1 Tax=Acaulospora morrowiae TaxID=94023 RepID=A0A9N9B1Y1_9GLOM|nr:3352_t:CDS:2 [Acaulospora morrowiae]
MSTTMESPITSFKAMSSSVHGSETSLSLRNVGPSTIDPPQFISDYYTERDPFYLEPKRKSEDEIKLKNKKIQEFYRDQNDLIDELLSPIDKKLTLKELANNLLRAKIAVNGSLVVNIFLFGLQLFSAISSGSLSLFATMADSFMDLLSNGILFVTGRVSHGKNLIKYPTGMARMETAGSIVFSTLMSTLSIQLIIEAIKTLINKGHDAEVHILSIICILVAIVSKSILLFYCWSQRQFPSARILAQDHRNDIVINTFGLIMYLLSARIVWWIDPAGAILIALCILRSWGITAYEQIKLIVGKSADTTFLRRATYIAMTHHPKVLQVDTCRAYHAGNNLFVEVDIVMDKNTPLWESHDIGESLQIKLEKLENVERAFVHVDYETSHKPEHQKEE